MATDVTMVKLVIWEWCCHEIEVFSPVTNMVRLTAYCVCTTEAYINPLKFKPTMSSLIIQLV